MATFIAPVASSTPRKSLPAGNYPARCYQMIMLGTHEEDYKGDKKTVFKLWIGWEFPTKLDVFQEDKGEQPYTMGKEYSFFMNDKANLRKDIEAWAGKKFTDEQAKVYDIGRLLGKACLLNVQEYNKQNGEEGVKIGGISPMIDGMTCPPLINPIQALTFEDFKADLFESLPKFLKEKIQKSPEYQALNQPKYQPVTQPDDNQKSVDGLFDPNEEPPF